MKTKLLKKLRRRALRSLGIVIQVHGKIDILYVVQWRNNVPRYELPISVSFDDYNKAVNELFRLRRCYIILWAREMKTQQKAANLVRKLRKL